MYMTKIGKIAEMTGSTSNRRSCFGSVLSVYFDMVGKWMLAAMLTLFSLGFMASHGHAANWFVRPSGGTGSGTSWTAAWNGLSNINWSSVSCGDTIWIAGGSYSDNLSLNKNCTSGNRLYVRRARSDSTECTSAAGWSSGFDATVTQTRADIRIGGGVTAKHITVSGRTTADGGNHGWHINYKNATSGVGINFIDNSVTDSLTFEYLDVEGPGYITYSGNGRGIDMTPFPNPYVVQCHNITFSHIKIWDWESLIYAGFADGPIFEYLEMTNAGAVNWSTYHPNGIYIVGVDNGTVRYSKFYKSTNSVGEGVFFQSSGSDGWEIYGNIFHDLNQSGTKAISIKETTLGLKIFNNTFSDNLSAIYGSGNCGTGSETRNNLFYNGSGSCGTASNNLTTSSTNVFVDYAGKDFRIVETVGTGYPRNAGTNLSAYFTTDRGGNPFGADGAWDIGAYEYVSYSKSFPSNPPSPISAPSGLSIIK
jgi:hypothetical protein